MSRSIETEDGILIEDIPNEVTDDEIKARINKIRSERDGKDSFMNSPYANSIKGSLLNVGTGFLKGGPMGAASTALGEAYGNLDKAVNYGSEIAGGAVTDKLAPYTTPEVAAGAGVATKLALPTLLGGIGGGMTIKPAMQKVGQEFMHSALKPHGIGFEDADDIVKVMLERGINVSRGGYKKLKNVSDELYNAVMNRINQASGMVDKTRTNQAMIDLYIKRANQVNNKSDLGTIGKSWNEFNRTYPNPLTLQQAQKLKVGTHKMLSDKAYRGELNTAGVDAEKSLVRGLKEGIEDIVPEVGPMNRQHGAVIETLDQLGKRVGVAENSNLVGLTPLVGNTALQLGMMADRSSFVKSLIARLLYEGRNPAGIGGGAVGGALYGISQGKGDNK